MKILAFVDIHEDIKALNKIIDKSHSADLLVCAGDLTVFEQNMDLMLSMLNKIGKPVLIIPGNHETSTNLKKACALLKNIIYLHKRSYEAKNYLFLGHGGGGFSTHNPQFEKIAKVFSRKITNEKKVVFVSHEPPYGTKLDLIDGHCGSKSLRKFIKENNLKLVICGHLHENKNKIDKINNTVIINPGPYGKIIDI